MTVTPRPGARCTETVRLCRGGISGGSCDGSSTSLTWAFLEPQPEDGVSGGLGLVPVQAPGSFLLESDERVEVELMACQPAGGLSGCARTVPPKTATEEEVRKLQEQDEARCARDRQRADRETQARQARCEQEARARVERKRHHVRCEILTGDPCARTLTARCTGKNPHEDSPPLNRKLTLKWKKDDPQRALRVVKRRGR